MNTPLRTQAEARQWMDEQGLSKAELARRFGVTSSLVDAILRGSKPCKRGISHNIAVYLGLKRGQAVAKRQPFPAQRAAAQHAGVSA
jgi:gp16 family phage-associated protein